MKTRTIRRTGARWALVALGAAVLVVGPAMPAGAGGQAAKKGTPAVVASGEGPLAHAVLYEVAEALRFKGPRAATSSTDFTRRLAEATLLGKEVWGRPGTVFGDSEFVVAWAESSVSLVSGTGPLRGEFHLLKDTDPARESLDTLVITTSVTIRGHIDLSTAGLGYATMQGHWRGSESRNRQQGTFTGIFLIPFRAGEGYWYLDLGPAQGTCAGRTDLPMPDGTSVSACPLQPDEFSLGLPLTKAVVVLYD